MEKNRKTVYDVLKEKGVMKKLGMVGRLDVDTSGVILFTSDSKMGQMISCSRNFFKRLGRMEDESKRTLKFHTKEYVVTVSGKGKPNLFIKGEKCEETKKEFEKEMLAPLKIKQHGIEFLTKPPLLIRIEEVWKESYQQRAPSEAGYFTARVLIRLAEGKNHQIRRICNRSNLTVKSLHRRCVAGILTDSLVPKPSDIYRLTPNDLKRLRVGLGLVDESLSKKNSV